MDQKVERGLPEILLLGFERSVGCCRNDKKRGYWKSASPRVAEEVQRGKMSPRCEPISCQSMTVETIPSSLSLPRGSVKGMATICCFWISRAVGCGIAAVKKSVHDAAKANNTIPECKSYGIKLRKVSRICCSKTAQ